MKGKEMQKTYKTHKTGIVEIELDATVRFQETNDAVKCVIQNVTRDYTDFMIIASDPRICEKQDVDLDIIVPLERSPIKCTGRVAWCLDDDPSPDGHKEYLARISIVNISRINLRRLDLLTAQRQAYMGTGYGRSIAS